MVLQHSFSSLLRLLNNLIKLYKNISPREQLEADTSLPCVINNAQVVLVLCGALWATDILLFAIT